MSNIKSVPAFFPTGIVRKVQYLESSFPKAWWVVGGKRRIKGQLISNPAIPDAHFFKPDLKKDIDWIHKNYSNVTRELVRKPYTYNKELRRQYNQRLWQWRKENKRQLECPDGKTRTFYPANLTDDRLVKTQVKGTYVSGIQTDTYFMPFSQYRQVFENVS